jgi:hypothetical protein
MFPRRELNPIHLEKPRVALSLPKNLSGVDGAIPRWVAIDSGYGIQELRSVLVSLFYVVVHRFSQNAAPTVRNVGQPRETLSETPTLHFGCDVRSLKTPLPSMKQPIDRHCHGPDI